MKQILTLATVTATALGTGTGADALPQDLSLQRRITPVVEVVQRTRPSVVYIQSDVPSAVGPSQWLFGGRPSPQQMSGSGVVIYEDGYIVTNFHVVRGATRITVNFDSADDPRPFTAELVSHSEAEDLALLKIEGDRPFPTVPMTSDDPLLGETVIAIGNPYGQTHTVSTGIISGLHRDILASGLQFRNLIQTDASINPGNSGGPLLNINGELIGINTAMNMSAENIGFAIPVARVRRVLMEHLSEANSWLGFTIAPEDFRVESVFPGGPADLAGLHQGDRVLAIGPRAIESDEDYNVARLAILPEQEVDLKIEREGRRRDMALTAWNRVDGFLLERTGMTVERTLLGDSYSPYLKVARVQPEGPAAGLGLREGDVIAAVRSPGRRATRLQTIEDFAWLVSRFRAGTPLTMEVWRDDDLDGLYERDEEYSELYKGVLELR